MKNNLSKFMMIFSAFVIVCAFSASVYAEDADKDKTSNVKEEKNAWLVRCNEENVAPEDKKGKCEIFQRQSLQDTGQRLIEFAIGFPKGRETARGIFVLPTGILLEPGVQMQIDDGKPVGFNVRYCLPNGCYAYVSLNDAIIDRLRKGNSVTVHVTNTDGGKIKLPMPLNGFSSAIEEVS